MKKILLIIMIVSLLFINCSDKDDTKLDCDKYCANMEKCEDTYKQEASNCKQLCNNINEKGYFDKNYLKDVNDCLNKDDCEKIESCVEEAQSKCPQIDGSKYYEAVCSKMIECKANSKTKEECIEEQKKEYNNFSCNTEKYVTDLTNCVSKVTCENYTQGMMNCLFLILQ